MTTQDTVKCPKCFSDKVRARYTCHTYGRDNKWYTCRDCDSAIRYCCYKEGCDWNFIHGLNENNPRNIENMKNKPDWLPEKLEYEKIKNYVIGPKKIESVKWSWEDDENFIGTA